MMLAQSAAIPNSARSRRMAQREKCCNARPDPQHLCVTPSTCKAGLTDVLVAQIAANRGCTHAVSFDKGAVRHAGMTLLA